MQIEQIDRGAEYVLVPRKAIDWLFGAGPDNDGYHFGDELAPRGRGNFWWRSKFREMIPALSARPAVGEDVVERVARALHADRKALDGMCYADAELKDWGDGDLKATVDGEVNFSALARAAIVALGGAAPLTDPQPMA